MSTRESDLPPLPEPRLKGPLPPATNIHGNFYTADQMREYGRQCAEAERQKAEELLLAARAVIERDTCCYDEPSVIGKEVVARIVAYLSAVVPRPSDPRPALDQGAHFGGTGVVISRTRSK